jgi:hypothetical protein
MGDPLTFDSWNQCARWLGHLRWLQRLRDRPYALDA